MRNQLGFVILFMALLALAGIPGPNSEAPDSVSAVKSPAVQTATPSMVVSRDPDTGRLRPATAAEIEALSQEMEKSLTASTEDLEVIPSPVAGGGEMVRLGNRFQNTYRLSVTAGGDFASDCDHREGQEVAP